MDNRQYKIDYKQVINLGRITEGASATIFLCKYLEDNIASKVISRNNSSEMLYEREVSALKELTDKSAENVVKLIGHRKTKNYFQIYIEYLSKCTLREFVFCRGFNWETKYTIIQGIVNGLKWIHESGWIHRDIKLENIVFSNSSAFCPKIIDFGYAIKNDRSIYSFSGTPAYVAPEILKMAFLEENLIEIENNLDNEYFQPTVKVNKDLIYTEKYDIFSLAIVMWQIAIEREYAESRLKTDNFLILYYLVIRGIREDIPFTCVDEIRQLIKDCWQDNPVARPSAGEILMRMKSWDLTLFSSPAKPSTFTPKKGSEDAFLKLIASY